MNKKLTTDDLDKVRHIEGFPNGRDEDIIALSDPPYFTACPNPFLEDFMKERGKAFDEATDDYHREPFAADVVEGRSDPIYNLHTYHTKVPYSAIMRYILHYTEPGDLVLDGFCGTGMTGIAAYMCGLPSNEVKVRFEKEIPKIKWGQRNAILIDISPIATLIASSYHVDTNNYENLSYKINDLASQAKSESLNIYTTRHNNDRGIINFVIWSDVFICPQCLKELIYWDIAIDKSNGNVYDNFLCPSCNMIIVRNNLEKCWVTKYDDKNKEVIKLAKQLPVLINYSVGKKRFEKVPDEHDMLTLQEISNINIPYWYPTNEIPNGINTNQAKVSHGFKNIHHYYTTRNLFSYSYLWNICNNETNPKHKKVLRFCLTSMFRYAERLCRLQPSKYFSGGQCITYMSGALYVPSLNIENNIFHIYENRLKRFLKIYNHLPKGKNNSIISTQSSTNLENVGQNSVDYIFTDPPFGSNLMYSELNYIWESWLKVFTNTREEAIINKFQNKKLIQYQTLMERSLRQMYYVLKPGRWITIVFHNSKNSVWNAIQASLLKAGFVVADVRILNKKQGSFKQVTTSSAMKEDLIVSAYKPKTAFLNRFIVKAGTKEGVWEFIRQHLEQLPLVVIKDNLVELIAERQNYMLYDRMVAYHLENNYTIPISAPEFYQELYQQFPERDGMYFLSHQIPQYEQKRATANGVGQLSLYVQDERTAIQWTRAKLEGKRQTLQELTPQFLKEINYVRWEKQLELSEILDQNFLQDDEDRWYVPDPNKQADLVRLREKALLKEFEQYRESKGKLKLFRTEAIRAGFKACWKSKDFQTVVSIGQRIPEAVIQDDSSLLMYYNNALTRIED